MNTASRTWISIAVIAVTLLIALIWSLSFLADASDDADRAAADTALATHSAKRIESKRPIEMQTNSIEKLAAQLPHKLDDAMKVAEIEPENLDRISPQPPRRIGQGDFSETPMQLVFHQVSLRQLLQFVSSLTHDNPWLTVRDVHLTHASSVESSTSNAGWTIELTISYLSDAQSAGGASAN
jgi:hypothetical protein